jgi:predicted RNA binding protein YcfA (HicA-like mRNA interferase family)
MPRLPTISGERLVRALKRAGFVELRQKGSHVSLKKERLKKPFVPSCRSITLWQKELSLTFFAKLASAWIS